MTDSKPLSGLDYTAKSPETGFRSKHSRYKARKLAFSGIRLEIIVLIG